MWRCINDCDGVAMGFFLIWDIFDVGFTGGDRRRFQYSDGFLVGFGCFFFVQVTLVFLCLRDTGL